MKVLVFDTETTGLPTERNPSIYETQKWPHVIQLSYIVYDSETNDIITVEDDYISIDSTVTISPESQKIHNISRETLHEKGISIQEALDKFNKFSGLSDLLVGHNVSFDKRMVIVEGIRNKIRMNIHDTYCTMKNSVELCKIEKVARNGDVYFKYPTLSELHEELFQKIPKNTHNALIDILICMRCFIKLELNKDISRINRTIRFMLRDSH
jgi:DNA polymerase III epsilon subunit-like protein